MSFRERMLSIADKLRYLPTATTFAGGPGFDIRPNVVTVVVRTWTSGKVESPWPAEADVDYIDDPSTLLTPTPKVRRVTSGEIAGSGGLYEQGDLIVAPITPFYEIEDFDGLSVQVTTGGYTPEQLDPVVTDRKGVQKLWILEGPNGGTFRLIDLRRDRSFRYEAVIRRLRDTP